MWRIEIVASRVSDTPPEAIFVNDGDYDKIGLLAL
jgi:hypothetical protein